MTVKQIQITSQSNITLGKQGENGVVEVLFIQPEELISESWQLNHQRATDKEAYPCPLEKRGNALAWKVTSGDTAAPGIGNAELTCYGQNGEVMKSQIYNTCVLKSVTTGGKVPDPVKPWYDDLLDKIDQKGSTGNTDLSLGITGGTAGQIAQIVAVDESGRPTAWTAVDKPSGSSGDSAGAGESVEDIEIISTEGKFAKWATGEASGGAESSTSWAAHSQFIPVTPGETLRITCKAANACPGVVFYKADTMSANNGVGYALENPGTGDPVSGSTNRYTYTKEDVVVPTGAAYAILNNADAYQGWACQKVTVVSGGNDNTNIKELEQKLANAEYETEQLVRRLTNAEKYNDFTWGTFDKAYFVFVHDDSREFIQTAYNAFHAKGVPLSSAAIAPYLGNTHGGKTVKEWLDLIVADGGEVLCHYSYDLHDSDDDSVWYKYIVDAKREFEQKGFNIRGLILAGSSDVNSAKGEKFCRRYFDYADKVGTSIRYNLGRKLMLNWSSLDAFKQRIDSCAKTPGIYAFGFHGDRTDEAWITEESLKELIDYISVKENCEITTYGAVFDAIGTSELEKRINALGTAQTEGVTSL